MEIAMKVSDELMRDAAVKDIVEFCLRANDTRTSRKFCSAPSRRRRSATA